MERIKKGLLAASINVVVPIMALAKPIIDDDTGGPMTTAAEAKAFVLRLEEIIVGAAGVIAIFMIFWGAAVFLLAGGNEEKLKHGREILQFAFIGLILILAAHALVVMFVRVLGGTIV